MKVLLIDKRDLPTHETSDGRLLKSIAQRMGSKKELNNADVIAVHDVRAGYVEIVKSRHDNNGSKMSLPIFSIKAFDGTL